VLPLTRNAQRLREAVLVNYSTAELEVIARFLADIVTALRDRNARLEAELAEKTKST
jgi:hypothetical protein